MRILLVNAFFPPRTTGSAHFSLDVARRFAAAGHEVTVLTTDVDGAPRDERQGGVRIVRLPARSVNARRLSFNYTLPFVVRRGVLREVMRVMREVEPDVVHQHGQFFDLTFVTTIAARRLGVPRVLTVHTPLVHTGAVLRRFIPLVERTVLRAASAPGAPTVVGVDRSVCELAQARLRPRRGVRFIPATLEIDRFRRGDGARIRRAHGLGDRPVILSLGHVIPTRSRLPLIRALPEILERHPDAITLVVGGVYDERFLAVAEELGVRDSVVAVGPVPHASVADYLAAATIDCHDLDGHTLGITTMEAMAAGVPVFAIVRRDVFPGVDFRDWPSLNIVEQATPAEIAAVVGALLDSPARRTAVAAEQFRFVSRYFGAGDVADRYLELFAEVVPAAATPPATRVSA